MSIGYTPYDLDVPDRLNMADFVVDRWVRQGRGDAVAFVNAEEELTYAALQARMNRSGNVMRSLGVERGDRVLIRSTNAPEIIAIILGCLKLGAVPMAVSSLFRSDELGFILQNSEAKVAVSTQALAGPLREVSSSAPSLQVLATLGGAQKGDVALEPLLADASDRLDTVDTSKDDAAFIFYTSGTSGNPKGICHAHHYLIGSLDPISRFFIDMQPHERMYNPHEISFSYAFGWTIFTPLFVGASSVLHAGRLEPRAILEYVQRFRPSILPSVPTLFGAILALEDKNAYDVSSLRLIISAGSPLFPQLAEGLREYFGCEVREAIGQSECQTYISQWGERPIKPGSLGYPLPGYHIRIVDGEGNDCPPETIGTIAIRGDHPSLFYEYRGLPEMWEQTHRDGWYLSGDMGHVDGDGCIWFDARGDDLIKSRGYSVSPDEIERVMSGHPAVAEVGVISVPDDYYGQRIRAYVTLRSGRQATEDELKDHVRQRLAPFKVPQDIFFLDTIPRTATGKLRRVVLRELRDTQG